MKKHELLLLLSFILFTLALLLSCTQPNPKNPFDTDVDPTDWAPKELQYEIITETCLKLTWKDNSKGEEGFILERKINNSNWSQLSQLSENVNQYNDNSVNKYNTYSYRIYAFAAFNNSSYSNELNYHWAPQGMIFIKGSTFLMGDYYAEGSSYELPVHTVSLDSFFISKYEITHFEYIEFLNDFGVSSNGSYNGTELINMNDNDCAIDYNDSNFYFDSNSYAESSDCPILGITWYGSSLYCNWKSLQKSLTPCYNLSDWSCDFSANGYRLPTEAEWEYAARGGINWEDNFKYSGTTDNLGDYAWYSGNNTPNGTKEVGTKLDNQLEIHDMSGNVWEWCWDWYDSNYYSFSPSSNPHGPDSGNYRVVRGGSWFNYADYCRVAYRGDNSPSGSFNGVGFRISRTP